jgi:hypothetical protein
MVASLKFIYSSTQVSDVLVLTVHCKPINFAFPILPLIVEMSAGLTSYILQINPFYLYFGVLHPVARTLSMLLEEPSLATTLHGVYVIFYSGSIYKI